MTLCYNVTEVLCRRVAPPLTILRAPCAIGWDRAFHPGGF